jgi:hypothetical protein
MFGPTSRTNATLLLTTKKQKSEKEQQTIKESKDANSLLPLR